MTTLTYEHPLNEKMRTYLRVEYLLAQLQQLTALQSEWQQQAFFNTLFDLIEVLDRNDIRADLIKDAERVEQTLVTWAGHPSVAAEKIQPLLQQAVRLQSELLRSGKFIARLKEEPFLAPLRQRFSLPGGTCFFDVPQLQFWFHLPEQQRQQKAASWCSELELVQQALQFVLGLIRQKSGFSRIDAENGFYQNNTEQHELLRIRYALADGVFPTVSGNKYRYAIRFMQLCDDASRGISDKNICFELASC